jgi:stress responsive alpha/beta barrel protein
MLLHIVCFKYKAEVDEATRATHRAQLSSLRTLDGVVDLKVGADVVRSPRSYDTGLAITFPDRAALDAYQSNHTHVPIAQWGASLSAHVVAVDFEI